MRPTRAHLGAVALALLLGAGAAAFAAWWLRTYERVEETVDLPPGPELRRNPLHVLLLALRADGVRAQARPRLQLERHPPAPGDTVLLYGDPRSLRAREAAALLAWVERGGHLLLRTPPPGPLDPEAPVPVLDALGLAPMLAPPACTGLRVRGEGGHVEFCRGRRFTAPDAGAPRLAWASPEGGYVYMRLAHGAGTVDVLADFDYLGNAALKEPTHIALARQLLAPNYRGGTVHLIYDARMPSFWATLLRQHWMAWAPLLLALLGALWARAQRFGPLLEPAPRERRSLLEHVEAAGAHAYRYGYGHLLHAAAREAFLARLRRRDPRAAALAGETQAALLAERFGLPPAQIRDALATPFPHDHAGFRQRVATLVRLRNSL
ncbi:DUF4350 domain-containing protein [Vulcaniibacterium tengchongense]|uniref:Uncharacterized protein DUF4350 n=1 Tax=Vulcaniibacterium tengchongense TaxID=1273429 RepID=A0A3N4VS61_9GAMM|nr:DUF4350 domain-containing protein [Vulcaniibacterium tengchongense]RPE79917.1 uncharacterized protein DUF4350 [Vulcaniibacterium tengchongense]